MFEICEYLSVSELYRCGYNVTCLVLTLMMDMFMFC